MGESCCRKLTYSSKSAEATQALGEALGRHVRAGDLIALVGPLGAGKTCFITGLARGMGVSGRVASPTFILARTHPGPVPLVHADAYRIGPDELIDIGLEEWLRWAVVAIEWADRVMEVLPDERLVVELVMAPHGRRVTLCAQGDRGLQMLEALSNEPARHRDLELAG